MREESFMVIFATPDFGTSSGIALVLLIVGAVVLTLVLVGILWGVKLLGNSSPRLRRRGALLLLVSGLVPTSCCVGPPQVVRLVYGNYPLWSYPNNKIGDGMTEEEVKAILGSPHERWKRNDEEGWYYWLDSFGIRYFGVDFGPDGRVIRTYGN
jgi:hypothetical protein